MKTKLMATISVPKWLMPFIFIAHITKSKNLISGAKIELKNALNIIKNLLFKAFILLILQILLGQLNVSKLKQKDFI